MRGAALAALLALAACAPQVPSYRQIDDPIVVDPSVPPAALAGLWYEVARFPNAPQAGCGLSTAEYTPRADGTLAVRNTCGPVVAGGPVRTIAGVATPAGPGALRVALEGVPVAGRLLILGRSPDGRTVLLGTPFRNGGWVLHRDADFSRAEFLAAQAVFGRSGYDEAALQRRDWR